MKKSEFQLYVNGSSSVKWLSAILLLVILAGCATSFEPGDPLIPVGDETPGPGLFSGEEGVFHIAGGDKLDVTRNERTVADKVRNEDLQGTSDLLDEKIKQLEQQQQALEQLKREVNKKLKTN